MGELNTKKKTGRIFSNLLKYCPVPSLIFFTAAAAALIVHVVCIYSAEFSDIMNDSVCRAVRFILAKITGWFPFSLAETVMLCLPLIFVLMILHSIRISRDATSFRTVRYLCSVLSVVTLLYSFFVFGFAPAYHGSNLEEKLGIERRDVSAEELYETAEILKEKAEELADDIVYINGGASVMPYTAFEMNDKLNDAYASFCDKNDFVQKMNTKIKHIAVSKLMTYTHIAGVYTYYTGEANLNTNFPGYTLPYTAAHELSHQRGTAREDEANFLAFLVCMESDDSYIRYSGYLNLFEYVAGALYKADGSLYSSLMSDLDMRIYSELFSYNKFFDKYRDLAASKISGTVNDTYLKSQGQEAGTDSYGRVVDLAVAYFIPN